MITQASERVQSVLVICVNYHSAEDTQAFVKDLLGQESPGSLRVIVVDNSDPERLDPRLSSIAEADPRVRVLHPGGNLGYFGGAAWALRQHLAGAPLTDWIVVSNTDIRFPGRDFLTRLFELYVDATCAVLAPAIHSTLSLKDQNPYMLRRPGAARMCFYKWVFRYYPISVAYQLMGLVKQKLRALTRKIAALVDDGEKMGQPRPRSIYAPHGSVILFSRSYFEAGGSLDHGVFLFGEEVFVAETARRLGLTVTYDPRLVVLHREHATTDMFKNRKMARYVREASAYCADKFFRQT